MGSVIRRLPRFVGGLLGSSWLRLGFRGSPGTQRSNANGGVAVAIQAWRTGPFGCGQRPRWVIGFPIIRLPNRSQPLRRFPSFLVPTDSICDFCMVTGGVDRR